MRTVVRRLLLSIPLLIVVSAAVFVLNSLAPGNVTWTILGDPRVNTVPAAQYKVLAHQLGIDRSLPVQYFNWVRSALHGNLGTSLVSGRPVTEIIGQRYSVTLSLVVGALIVSVVFGVGLGLASAVRGGVLGKIVDVLSMAGWVLPVYWIAIELVVIFSIKLGWLPATGYVPFSQSPTQWLRSLLLPVIALSLGPIGAFAKITRQAMLESLSSDYVRMALANGIAPASVIFQHALKTASLQLVTLAGIVTIGLLSGTVFAEIVFVLPGLGSALVSSVTAHDLTAVQGIVVVFTLVVVLVNLLVDLAYTALNPKIHVR